ncbi:MAG: YebC/PmpR family DNA-binding transcriptional regulator [Verrucomicrobia bacterium]|nr:YebC/PmpR family DNA-binding transcriptional regulator [Verrucomicrobiota bacterium]
MGRQWLHAKREVVSLKKSKTTSKFVREITLAARHGADSSTNSRLAAALERARKESVSRDIIERAIQKGSGTEGGKDSLEHMVFEGYAPHKVPLILEVYTDNHNRTAPEIRFLFKAGHLGASGSNRFLFDQVGIVEAHHPNAAIDREEAAIEAGANEVELLSHEQNDDIPAEACGARFLTERSSVHEVSLWLKTNGWTVVISELGYVPKNYPELGDELRAEVGNFLQSLEDHEDVHRIWAAVR